MRRAGAGSPLPLRRCSAAWQCQERSRRTVRVVGSAGGLSLSDLALGIRGASARWEPAPGDTVLLTPFDLFPEGAEVELYYEAGGARPRHPRAYLTGLLTRRVISNMLTCALPPNTGFNAPSALIMRLFLLSWSPFFLM